MTSNRHPLPGQEGQLWQVALGSGHGGSAAARRSAAAACQATAVEGGISFRSLLLCYQRYSNSILDGNKYICIRKYGGEDAIGTVLQVDY